MVAEPHGRPEAADRVSARVLSLVLVALSSADEGVDAAALSFLVQQAVLAQEKEKEEEEKRKEKELQEMFARLTGEYLRELSQASSSSSPRRWKKRKKKKLPKTSSHSSSGCARRRQRQWHARFAGFAGDDTTRAVFLVCLHAQDARLLGRYEPEGQFGWVLLVTILLALCSLFVFTTKMLGILVGMDRRTLMPRQRSHSYAL